MLKNALLHISNNFADQKIYVNLVKKLSGKGYNQIVYTALKEKKLLDGNRDESLKRVEYHYSFILSKNIFHRVNYNRNIRLKLNDIENKVALDTVSLIHAHFLFSDGGVAYLLKKKYGIKYVISVRSSDIVYFFKYMLHLRSFGNKILADAEKIIFINHAHKKVFIEKYLKSTYRKNILPKILIVPNAIENLWFEEQPQTKKILKDINLIYVGRIIKTKRLDLAILAVKRLNELGYTVRFDIVGDGEFLDSVLKHASENIIFHGRIQEIDKLKKLYERSHIFVMPSTRETFGLVYIEAMSQGLPIIYCENQAVDGFFDDQPVGKSVKPKSSIDIVKKIIAIYSNYETLSGNALEQARQFNWEDIASRYDSIYKSC
jgi:glycosyltransferase involved in cell wall biosynthesis